MESNETKKPRGRPFPAGQSGNPGGRGGRPKLDEDQKAARAEAQAIIDAHTPEAAWRLVDDLDSSDPRVKAAACSSILDRGSVTGVKRLELIRVDDGGRLVEPITAERAINVLRILKTAGALPEGLPEWVEGQIAENSEPEPDLA